MDGESRPANNGFSSRPLPIIGVRRVIMQSRAHDFFHRTNEVFFRGWGVAGIVESWPKTLVPSASSLSTPEWSPVESPQGLDESNFALVVLPKGQQAGDRQGGRGAAGRQGEAAGVIVDVTGEERADDLAGA